MTVFCVSFLASTVTAAAAAAAAELDLSGSGRMHTYLALHIGKLQAAAPNLELLRLDGLGGVFGEGSGGSCDGRAWHLCTHPQPWRAGSEWA